MCLLFVRIFTSCSPSKLVFIIRSEQFCEDVVQLTVSITSASNLISPLSFPVRLRFALIMSNFVSQWSLSFWGWKFKISVWMYLAHVLAICQELDKSLEFCFVCLCDAAVVNKGLSQLRKQFVGHFVSIRVQPWKSLTWFMLQTVTEGKKTLSKEAVVSSVDMMGFCWRVSCMKHFR